MLTTGAFIRLGYVYGNLMVNVQPKNAKLRGPRPPHHRAGHRGIAERAAAAGAERNSVRPPS